LLCHVHCCRELTNSSGTTFEVDISDSDVGNDTTYFDKEELLQCVNYDCINVDSDEDDAKSEPGVTPFQRMASKMTSLTEDGKVKKRVCYLYL
jgi:hypothetical protein